VDPVDLAYQAHRAYRYLRGNLQDRVNREHRERRPYQEDPGNRELREDQDFLGILEDRGLP